MKNFLVLSFIVFAVLSCSPRSDYLVPRFDPENVKEDPDFKLFFSPKVDILFVIDNSGSMGVHQQNLSDNISEFVNALTNYPFLDFQIGVISSDPGDNGSLEGIPSFVDKSIPGYQRILEERLLLGTGGSGVEAFFDPVISAITPPKSVGVNRGFLRPDAILATIFITDTEDQSDHFTTAQSFYDKLLEVKSNRRDLLASYGVIIPSEELLCVRDSSERDPVEIERFFALSNAKFFDLCTSDFGLRLSEIGDDLVQKAAGFVPLGQRPVVETIVVSYGGIVIPNDRSEGWSYDPSRIGLIFAKDIQINPDDLPPNPELVVTFTPSLQ